MSKMLKSLIMEAVLGNLSVLRISTVAGFFLMSVSRGHNPDITNYLGYKRITKELFDVTRQYIINSHH